MRSPALITYYRTQPDEDEAVQEIIDIIFSDDFANIIGPLLFAVHSVTRSSSYGSDFRDQFCTFPHPSDSCPATPPTQFELPLSQRASLSNEFQVNFDCFPEITARDLLLSGYWVENEAWLLMRNCIGFGCMSSFMEFIASK
ncbi:hypothetical protein CEXT_571881 [Caerostris extrusa]|uniref:Uncharacterized protein n=1 Tax=Caerostris extrusa TaxID=172846 RepID=A0AAV4T8F2_CAEEX|nr:hypothetical protein CEXT_571881 [Caerostris extrusa]